MARAARRAGAVPRRPRTGHEPLRHRAGRFRGASPAHRQPEKAHRGDGGGEPRRGAAGFPGPLPGGLLRPAQGAHRVQGLLLIPRKRRRRRPGEAASVPSPPAASGISSQTRETTFCPARRWSRCSTCGSLSRSFGPPPRWSAPRRCGRRPPRTPSPACWWWTRCGASCSTPRARPSW